MSRIDIIANRVASTLVASVSVGGETTLIRDAKNKNFEFKAGERVKIVEYGKEYPYTVRVQSLDGTKRISFLVSNAWQKLHGFPKPPSMATIERWSNDGVAKSIDGHRVELDGYSPDGAPSWGLVMGIV